MIALNTVDEQKNLIPEWRAKNKYTFPILIGLPEDRFLDYQFVGAPMNLLVDAQQRIRFRHRGGSLTGRNSNVLEAEIRELLGLDPFVRTATGSPPR